MELDIRLQVLERKVREINQKDSSFMPSSANSVIVSLRWNFLNALEKPLKNFILPGNAQNGLAFQ